MKDATDFNVATLGDALGVLNTLNLSMTVAAKRYPINASNRKLIALDQAALEHLIEFVEFNIQDIWGKA